MHVDDLVGVLVDVEEKVAWVTFDRPEQMNAITMDMARSLVVVAEKFEQLAWGDQIRIVVLRGAGDQAFCAGADLKQRRQMDEEQLWRHADFIRRFVLACYRMPVPVIAAIHGHCLGGGLEIAVACDLRIVALDASIGFTEVRIGAFPGAGGAVFTPKLVGPAVAKDLLYTGRRITGAEAASLGLANHAVSAERLFKVAAEVARTIASNGPLAVRALKRVVNRGSHASIEDAFELSDALRRPLNATADYAEGLAAFADRREPVFHGR
jgi:methylglutaconyl-CoA hydratase